MGARCRKALCVKTFPLLRRMNTSSYQGGSGCQG